MNDKLISFYRGTSTDSSGRTIESIWQFDHSRLESAHDYIQWLFPSTKRSQFNWGAPLLDAETIELFLTSADLKAQLRKSLEVMLDFYGLELLDATEDGALVVRKAAHYDKRKDTWQNKQLGFPNHNLLRLTRILEALHVLGLADEGAAFFRCLAEIQLEEPNKIPTKTLHYWQAATG